MPLRKTLRRPPRKPTDPMKVLQDRLSAEGVHTLIAQFTDLHGVARGKFVPLNQLDLLLRDGVGFAGPSI